MAISFKDINQSLRSPGVFIEIDNSRAGSGTGSRQKLLLIGIATTTLTTIEQCFSKADAQRLYGNSQLTDMLKAAIPIAADSVDIYATAVAEPASGTAATATITVTANNNSAGTIYLSIGGTSLSVATNKGDTATAIARKIVAAINSQDLIVTASNSQGVVTLTAIHKGTWGNRLYVGFEQGLANNCQAALV